MSRRNVHTTALLLSLIAISHAAAAQTSSRPSDTPPNVSFDWRDHPAVSIGKQMRVELRVQGAADRRGSGTPLDGRDGTRVDDARRRVGIAGTIGKLAEFQVERELGGGWKDVFVNYRRLGPVEVQGGQFKLPFGLDENTSSSRLDFIYRSRAATELAPGRDLGAMAHGRAGIIRYEAGVFAGRTLAGRVVVQPWRKTDSVFEDLQAGLAYAASDLQEGMSSLRGDTALGRRFFNADIAVSGQRRRIGVEARWRPGPFSLQAELVRVLDERRGQSTTTTDLPALGAAAWYAQGSWLATGERKTKGGDDPRRPLFDGGIGSVELAARVEAIRFGNAGIEAALAPRAEAIPRHGDVATTLGVNWSPNRWIRVQANLVREHVTVPAAAAWDTPDTFWSRILRIRFAL